MLYLPSLLRNLIIAYIFYINFYKLNFLLYKDKYFLPLINKTFI
jgi:hypothetical protein